MRHGEKNKISKVIRDTLRCILGHALPSGDIAGGGKNIVINSLSMPACCARVAV
jgi:hypothetical protein